MLTIVELQIEILLSSSINDVGLLCRMDRFPDKGTARKRNRHLSGFCTYCTLWTVVTVSGQVFFDNRVLVANMACRAESADRLDKY